MRDNDWDILVRSLQRQNCILFLGPELRGDPAQLGGTDALLSQQLVEEMGEKWNAAEPLSSIAFRFLQKFSRDDLQWQVEHFVQMHEPDKDYFDVLCELARLPFYLVITSLYDSVLQGAFEAESKTPLIDGYDFRGGTPANVDMGTEQSPLIYHLHGRPGSMGHLVMTEQDLIDFLIAIISKNPPLPQSLAAELQKPVRSLLFIGFGIKHWYLRLLLHVLHTANPDSRSFALEAFNGVAPSIREQTVFFYKSGHKLEIFDENVPNFIHELRARFDRAFNLRATLSAPQDSLSGDPPRVFLSYAHEDGNFVRRVYQGLRNAGMDPWMDDEGGLLGGDRWDPKIEAEIKHSDYFLSFQSLALGRKTIGYVNKELALAQARQQYFRAPRRYLIPVSIHGSKPLPELSSFQTVRLDDPEDIGALVSLIKRDYQLRGRA